MTDTMPAATETSGAAKPPGASPALPPAAPDENNKPLSDDALVGLVRQAHSCLYIVFSQEATDRAIEKREAELGRKLTDWEKRDENRYKAEEKDFAFVRESMTALSPKDMVEGMLTVQMTALHFAAMKKLQEASKPWTIECKRDECLQHATKLTKAFASLAGAFNHRRDKGNSQQTITVQHVNIADGGQAVVAGNVSP